MKIGDIYIITGNTIQQYYKGNPLIITSYGNHSSIVLATIYLEPDKKIKYDVAVHISYMKYIGSNDIINYINIL